MELLKKLNVKDQTSAFVWNPPEEFTDTLKEWTTVLSIQTKPSNGTYPFVLFFLRNRAALEESKETLKSTMDPEGLIWVAYPKKSSKKYTSDISRDDFWDAFLDLGLEPVRQIALDDHWSALRFKPGTAIKRNNR
jgi:hypothetical protein